MDFPIYVDVVMFAGRLAVFTVLAAMVVIALDRSALVAAEKWGVGRRFMLGLVVWAAAVSGFVSAGVFVPQPGGFNMIAIAIVLPLVIFGVWLMRSSAVGQVLDAMPVHWLVYLQVYRVLGGVFVLLYLDGILPGYFALPAGIGDILVGIAAIYTAHKLMRPGVVDVGTAVRWNGLGVLDLVVAVSFGFMTAPGMMPFQPIDPTFPNVAIGHDPLVIIPTFIVPLSLMLHMLSVRQVVRRRKTEVDMGRTVPVVQAAPGL